MEKFDSVQLVKDLCKEQGIPIAHLERACGFCNGYIRGLREGVMPADRLMKISKFLNVPIDYLLTGQKEEKEFAMPDYDSRIHDIVLNFDDLSENQKDLIVNLVKEMSEAEKKNKYLEKYYNTYMSLIKK